MRYDDDRYYSDDEDNDLWDDELELNSDDYRPEPADTSPQPYVPYTSSYDNTGEEYDENTERHDDEPDDYYSDPEPSEPAKPRRRGFFEKKDDDDDEDGNDYFDSDSDSESAPKAKAPKLPKLDPEDPDYWAEEDEDSPLSGIIRPPKKKWIWKLLGAVGVILAFAGGWIWLFRPYADNAVKYGYILNMERRGSIFKTFEGTMIPYKELGDPNPLYFRKVHFSVASDSLAAVMKRMMLGCVPVRVEYETYHTSMPWKGEQTMIIIKADTADLRKIMPPEYR